MQDRHKLGYVVTFICRIDVGFLGPYATTTSISYLTKQFLAVATTCISAYQSIIFTKAFTITSFYFDIFFFIFKIHFFVFPATGIELVTVWVVDGQTSSHCIFIFFLYFFLRRVSSSQPSICSRTGTLSAYLTHYLVIMKISNFAWYF